MYPVSVLCTSPLFSALHQAMAAPGEKTMALQACLRSDLRLFLPGDEVSLDGKRATIARLHEDRTCTVSFADGEAPSFGVVRASCSSSSSSTSRRVAFQVQALEVHAGALVDNIKFLLADGSVRSFGDAGGSLAGRFELEEGEVLVGVGGRSGDSLDAVQFHTSRGRSSPLFGNPAGGQPFDLRAPIGQQVVGVHRGAGGCCPSIRGLVCAPRPCAFEAGQLVEIRGLESAAGRGWNGRHVRVAHEQACQPGRVAVLVDGEVKAMKEENLMLVAGEHPAEWQVLLQHCDLLLPRGNFARRTRSLRTLELVSSRSRGELNANGMGAVDGRRVEGLGREGVHHVLRLYRSEPLPLGMMVSSIEMEARGMDQGWGNTGDSGVVLYVVRAVAEDTAPWDEEGPLLKINYNREVSRSHDHTARVDELFGPLAPQPGDRLEVTLHCPSYPGWSAWVDRVVVRVGCVTEQEEVLPGSTPSTWQEEATNAFSRLWHDLAEDDKLDVDASHLSIRGQLLQGVWQTPPVPESASAVPPVAPRLRELCRGRPMHGAERLADKLDQNLSVAGAPQDADQRLRRYAAMRATIHRSLDALEVKPELVEVLCRHFGEAADDCVYRWDREIVNMHDLATGQATGADARTAEDEVLRVLCAARRQLAETVLHRAKGAAGNSDMHFESYFYGSIHFGLPEQLEAARDPNRLNYGSLNMLRPATVQKELLEAYSPAAIRRLVRTGLWESKAPGMQAVREKCLDWMRANVPAGFRPELQGRERQEVWLYEQCHDEGFQLRDEALNFMLCRMHILRAENIACLAGDPAKLTLDCGSGGRRGAPAASDDGGGAGGRQICAVQ